MDKYVYYKNLGTTTVSRVYKGLFLKTDNIQGFLGTPE